MILNKIHILFLIRSLHAGGAERQIVELARGLDKDKFEITICLFYNEGELRKDLLGVNGVRLLSLNKSGRWDLLRFSMRLTNLLRKLKPAILYSFLPEANIAGLVAGRLAGVLRIVWGIRASNMDAKYYDWLFKMSRRFTVLLSMFPDAIISNSFAGLSYHRNIGFCSDLMTVIPNGIDIKRFCPDIEAGRRVRKEWGISEETVLIGLVGRLDPMKDHPTFLKAAKIFTQTHYNVKFVCIGNGPGPYKDKLYALSEKLGLAGHLIWVGARNDMPSVYNAMNIVTSSSSYGEGFPNVIAEAMACGVPCVVTDVGDSALIVGNTGVVVPKENPEYLAKGWSDMLERIKEETDTYAEIVRSRIVSRYSSETLVRETSNALLNLL